MALMDAQYGQHLIIMSVFLRPLTFILKMEGNQF